MLTDSGGFQVFSLSELRKVTDDGVVSFVRIWMEARRFLFALSIRSKVQIALGADIISGL